MECNEYLLCAEESLHSLDVMQKNLEGQDIDFEKIVQAEYIHSPSTLTALDLAATLTFGVIGTIINNNEEIKKFLSNIHDDASTQNSKTLLGQLLHHSGDHMDKVPLEDGTKGYINRLAQRKDGIFLPGAKNQIIGPNIPHRIMWGHDIFSFGPDNPFYLMITQYGFGRGILQALRHLIADTCSHQGLPIPGHSFFDKIVKKSDGNVTMGNRLIDVANKINKEVGNSNRENAVNNEAFNSLFSINMQDVLAKGLTWGLTKAYIMALGINDEIRITQLHIIATGVNFYGTTFWGVYKTGVPTINWILLGSLIKLTAQLFIKSNRETEALRRITTEIMQSNIALANRVAKAGEWLPTYIDPWDYIKDYHSELDNISSLIDFFEEEF